MEVRVLGPVELVDGTSLVRLAPAERTLLAALASRGGERVAADVLEESLWPDGPPPTARKTLQGHVMRLRRVMGSGAVVATSGGYRLDPRHVQVDAEHVSRLVRDAREAIRRLDPDDAVGLLHQAGAAFRGDPYADVPDSALPAGELPRLHELRLAIIEEGFEAQFASGDGHRCIADVESFVESNPYRERAWAQLMLALYQAGRTADALAAYGRARQVLATELGLEPGPGLRDLERSILTHDPRLLTVGTVRDQLGPSNLPAGLSPIIGRQRELEALDRLCRTHRLVTLTGTGGVGKTRLAVDLAALAGERQSVGPYFVDLAPIESVALVPGAVAAAVGVEVDAHDDVSRRLRSALQQHSVLMVLDNCEHLLPAITQVAAELLSTAPTLHVVATSREPLDVAGERLWPLDPLDVPPATASIEQVQASGAAGMFLARLPVSVASGDLSPDDAVAVGAICRALEGIPLALDLAAGRSRTLSLPELADRLGHSISELTTAGHGVLPRHRTMAGALDWSYQLLDVKMQASLRAMSVFAGGCELSAFAAVCVDDPRDALAVVDELVRTSFATVGFTDAGTRYRLLEPVRQFAGELLDREGERTRRQDSHLDYYSTFARALAEAEVSGGPVPLEAMRRELGNLRVALDWACSTADRTESGLLLACAMYCVWTGGSDHAEGVDRIVRLLGTGAGSPGARSRAAQNAGIIAGHTGDLDRSLALCEQALDEARRGGVSASERRARMILAQILLDRGDVVAARRYLTPALPVDGRQTSDIDAFCLVSQLWIDLAAGDLDRAEAIAQEVLTGSFSLWGWVGTAVRYMLGEIMLERGELDGARFWLDEQLLLAERLADTVALIDGHLQLVAIECAAGRPDDADAHFRLASDLRRANHRSGDLQFLEARAALALHRACPRVAIDLAEAALELANEIGGAPDRCRSLRLLGDAQLAAGDPARAVATFQELIARADAAPFPCRAAEGHEGAAATARVLGQRRTADRHLAAATEIRRHTGTQRLRRPVVEDNLLSLAHG